LLERMRLRRQSPWWRAGPAWRRRARAG
jgi:hypothetical protein